MAGGAVNFFLDAVDDPLLPDQVPSFDGGQFSNQRANLLKENQSVYLLNCDIDTLGKLRTRRGTILVGDPAVGAGVPSGVAGTIIQGLTSYQTKDFNYIVAANNGKLWAWIDGTPGHWTQIALGGTADDEDILIARTGLINQPTVSTALPRGGYTAGTTAIVVDALPGGIAAPLLAAAEKLYFNNVLRTDYYEYTIKTWDAGTSTITLEEPGLVFDVEDNWGFTVLRPAKVDNPTPGNRYAAGTTVIGITGYNGEVFNTEPFVIKSENVTHTISAHVGAPTTQLTFTVPLQNDWAAANASDPIVFAQGNDQLFFTDGIGFIYGWKGGVPTSPTVGGGTLTKIGSHSILDNMSGAYTQSRTKPPTSCKSLLWFQNRLIASAIATEPDAIYFSDYFNATAWDADYQKTRIGGGESDPITGCLAWTDLNLIVFKKNSIYLVNLDPSQNPNPDDPTLLVASFAVKQLHKLIGCPAPFSAVQVGGGSTTPGSDVFFLDGDKRVHSVRRVMAAETQQEVGTAVSLPVQDILDTINIDHIDRVCAMYHNEHYIIGIPSMVGDLDDTLPNTVLAYNLLTQSWCGQWTWSPTCFARRTDLGAYSRLIFGNWTNGFGQVWQWLDDQSQLEETQETYQDIGVPLMTQIVSRAITFGDAYSYKTGLNVEFEFDESVAGDVRVKVLLDRYYTPIRLRCSIH